jgi:hypothetical protein
VCVYTTKFYLWLSLSLLLLLLKEMCCTAQVGAMDYVYTPDKNFGQLGKGRAQRSLFSTQTGVRYSREQHAINIRPVLMYTLHAAVVLYCVCCCCLYSFTDQRTCSSVSFSFLTKTCTNAGRLSLHSLRDSRERESWRAQPISSWGPNISQFDVCLANNKNASQLYSCSSSNCLDV